MTNAHEAGKLLDIFSVMEDFGGHATTLAMRDPSQSGTGRDSTCICSFLVFVCDDDNKHKYLDLDAADSTEPLMPVSNKEHFPYKKCGGLLTVDFCSGGDESILAWICMYYTHNPAHNVINESDRSITKGFFLKKKQDYKKCT